MGVIRKWGISKTDRWSFLSIFDKNTGVMRREENDWWSVLRGELKKIALEKDCLWGGCAMRENESSNGCNRERGVERLLHIVGRADCGSCNGCKGGDGATLTEYVGRGRRMGDGSGIIRVSTEVSDGAATLKYRETLRNARDCLLRWGEGNCSGCKACFGGVGC